MSIAGISEHSLVVGQDSIKITVVRAACYSYGCPCGGQDYQKKRNPSPPVRGFRRAVLLCSSALRGQDSRTGVDFRAPRPPVCRHPRPIRAAHPSAGRHRDHGQSNRSIPACVPPCPGDGGGEDEKETGLAEASRSRVPLFFSVLARSSRERTDGWGRYWPSALGRKYSCGAHPPNPSRTAIRRRSARASPTDACHDCNCNVPLSHPQPSGGKGNVSTGDRALGRAGRERAPGVWGLPGRVGPQGAYEWGWVCPRSTGQHAGAGLVGCGAGAGAEEIRRGLGRTCGTAGSGASSFDRIVLGVWGAWSLEGRPQYGSSSSNDTRVPYY